MLHKEIPFVTVKLVRRAWPRLKLVARGFPVEKLTVRLSCSETSKSCHSNCFLLTAEFLYIVGGMTYWAFLFIRSSSNFALFSFAYFVLCFFLHCRQCKKEAEHRINKCQKSKIGVAPNKQKCPLWSITFLSVPHEKS